jgi:hypothetical protein
MWSLTSWGTKRISGPEKFPPPVKKDFFNNIGAKRTFIANNAFELVTDED